MTIEHSYSKEIQTRKRDELYADCQNWKSMLCFIDDEITFIVRLLNSYIFEPNTPNLFERIQDYQQRLKKVNHTKIRVNERISEHKNNLGGILECADDACDYVFYRKHGELKADVLRFNQDFQTLKAEIFNYAGGILKKKKA